MDVHDDPGDPDAHGEDARHQDVDGVAPEVPVLVCERGHGHEHHHHQQHHHIDERHDKVLVGDPARALRQHSLAVGVTRHGDDHPLGVDDDLHQPHGHGAQPQQPAARAPLLPLQKHQPQAVHEQAGEAASEQHTEEEAAHHARGEVPAHYEGDGQAEQAQREHQEADLQQGHALAGLVGHERQAGHLDDQQHERTDHAGSSKGLHHDAPRRLQVAQVKVKRLDGGAAAIRGLSG